MAACRLVKSFVTLMPEAVRLSLTAFVVHKVNFIIPMVKLNDHGFWMGVI